MRRSHYITICFLLFLLVFFPARGISQFSPDDEYIHREFDKDALKKLQEDGEFQYGKEPISKSWNHSPRSSGFETLWTILLYGLVGLVFAVVIYFILKGSFTPKSKTIDSEMIPDLDNPDVRALDFDQLLQQVVDKQAFREGVRLLYLETLKKLNLYEWIDWKQNKTNQDYQLELSGTQHQDAFDRLTYGYEYVWYGNFPISKDGFQSIQRTFKSFQSQLSPKR